MTVYAGDKWLINVTHSCYKAGTPHITYGVYININGWKKIIESYFYMNAGGIHTSHSASLVYTIPFTYTGNISLLLRCNSASTDQNDRATATVTIF